MFLNSDAVEFIEARLIMLSQQKAYTLHKIKVCAEKDIPYYYRRIEYIEEIESHYYSRLQEVYPLKFFIYNNNLQNIIAV